jgi:hypothetical protein
LLVPDLQRSGLFWHDYPVPGGGTLRQNVIGRSFFIEDPPAYGLRWPKDVPVEELENALSDVEAERVKKKEDPRADSVRTV